MALWKVTLPEVMVLVAFPLKTVALNVVVSLKGMGWVYFLAFYR